METLQRTAARPQRRRPWGAIIVVFGLLVVVANLIGYIVYREGRPQKEMPTPTAAVANDTVDDPTSVSALAKEQRENGIMALRAGSYDKAIASFDAALKLDPKLADTETLREVAERLRASAPKDDDLAKSPPPRKTEPVKIAAREVKPERERKPRPRSSRSRAARRARRSPPPPPPPVVVEPPPPEPIEAATTIVEPEPPADITLEDPPPSDIAVDEKLDLVALVDRDAPKDAPGVGPKVDVDVAPAETGPSIRPTTAGTNPRLVVFWPGRSSSALQQSLRSQMAAVDVRVYSRTSSLRRGLAEGADAVMASPSVLRSNGLSARLTAAGGNDGTYVAASLTTGLTRSGLSALTVGVVDELGRKGMPTLVAKLIGGTAPKLRRVTKVEDLLPLLQFDIAQAVIVRRRDFAALESRTQQKLHTITLVSHREPLAVGFVEGGRRSAVERAVRGLNANAKKSLGVDSWK